MSKQTLSERAVALYGELAMSITEVVTVPTGPNSYEWVEAFIKECVQDKLEILKQREEAAKTIPFG